ncbi:hypothetical protein [Pseudoalteromonas denitrificans]|uniref:MSHA biogenesis protein MshI n=1 Tax=Pseudoalteromonas denitrificans DSM 6059 TaxID=1123010 RepID=A0A1I1U638_9GAMM|nr:hypothetical protein [Pseudoalteromonas denitrificans]SFD66154.1 MSHA biogenesis protein MshI [Pseudoalteromonas denitrificans DSM 6059]
MIKNLLSRLPFLTKGKNNTNYIGLVIQLDKVIAVSLELKQDQWLVVAENIISYNNESELSTSITLCIDGLDVEVAKVAVVLPSHMYQIVQMDKPNLSLNEIKQSLPWTVKDLVTIPAESIIADFIENPIKQGGQEKISVFVANKTILMPIINSVQKSKAELEHITCEELALTGLLEIESAANLIVYQQLGQEPSIQIIREGSLVFSRRLRGFTRLPSMAMEDLSMGLLDSFSLEVQRSIDFFESQLKQPPLKSLQLHLPCEHLPEIVEQLKVHFPVKVMEFKSHLPHCMGQNEQLHFSISAVMELIGSENEATH